MVGGEAAGAAFAIARVLGEAQISSVSQHTRLVKELVQCRRQNDGFLEDWARCLQPLFLVAARKPAVEQAVRFCAHFAVYRDADASECDAFAEDFLGLLLEWAEAVDKTVRFRACQMVHEIMQRIQDDAMLSDDTLDRVVAGMLRRMQDRVAAVRAFAARSLARLAVATDLEMVENWGILEQYRRTLDLDENVDVRRWVVLSIPPISCTIPQVVERTADVHDSVRKAAFFKLGQDFPINSLSISQRTLVLERGLADRVPAVKAESLKMLKTWLQRDCQGDVLSLLKLMDVETHARVGETIMAELLQAEVVQLGSHEGPMKVFGPDGKDGGRVHLLEAEEALYWRMWCFFVHDAEQTRSSEAAASGCVKAVVDAENAALKQEALEKILPPTVADYVSVVERHILAGQHYRFASQQLLKIGKLLDFTDAVSRQVAALFLRSLLEKPDSPDVVDILGDGLSVGGEKDWQDAIAGFGRSVHASPGEWVKVLIEAVADHGRPCREGDANVMQWLHCLALTGLLLTSITSTKQLIGSAIEPSELSDALLSSAAKHIHPEVQRAGLRCLGLFCPLEMVPSVKLVQALRSALHSAHQPVCNMATKAAFDLIICHGPKCMEGVEVQASELEGSGHVGKPVMDILASWLDGDAHFEDFAEDRLSPIADAESPRGLVAEGFAKLLIRSKTVGDSLVDEAAILRKLLLIYFNNETRRLNQCLSVFFQNYTVVSADHKLCVARAFIPVVRCVWVGGHSLLSRQRATTVSRFMLQMMLQEIKKPAEKPTDDFTEHSEAVDNGPPDEGHEDLALRIANEVKVVLQQPKFPSVRLYVALLYRVTFDLQFRPSQQKLIKLMHSLVQSALENLSDDKLVTKTLLRELQIYAGRLKALDTTPDCGLTDEELGILLENLHLTVEPNGGDEAFSASVPTPATKRKTVKRRKKRTVSPVDSETSSPEVYTPAPRDRRRTRGRDLVFSS